MVVSTVSDLKRQFLLDNTGLPSLKNTISDLEYEYFSSRSGLTPKLFYSLADHKRKYLEIQTGLSGKTIAFLERTFWLNEGIVSGTMQDMAYKYYGMVFSPYLTGPSNKLELALDSSSITTVNSPNLLSYGNATCSTAWAPSVGAPTVTVDSTDFYSGSKSNKIVAIALGIAQFTVPFAERVSVVAGTKYNGELRVKLPVGITYQITIHYYNDSSWIGATNIPGVGNGTYQKVSIINSVAPVGAVKASFGGDFNATSIGNTMNIDEAGVYLSSTAPDAWIPSGIVPSYDGYSLAQWNDLSGKGRHVTQATGTKQPLYRNTSVNKMTYADSLGLTTPGTQGGATCVIDTTSQIQGTNSYKMVATTATAEQGVSILGATPAVGGQTYSFSAKVKQTLGTATVKFQIIFRNDALAVVSTFNSTAIALGTTVTTITVLNVVAPAGATKMTPKVLWNTAPAVGNIVYSGAIFMVTGATIPATWVPPVTLPNNLPTVQFDGLNDTLTTVMSTSLNADTVDGLTVYTIRCTDTMPGGSTLAVVSSANGATGWATGVVGGSRLNTYTYNDVGVVKGIAAGGVSVISTYDVTSSIFKPTEVVSSLNGGTKVSISTTGYTASTGVLGIGSTDNGLSRFLQGSISAVLIYSEEHSDLKRKRIEKWLGNKYGIAIAP